MSDDFPSTVPSSTIFRTILHDAIVNVCWFVGGMVVIVLVGYESRLLGLILAAVEVLLGAIQVPKVLLMVLGSTLRFLGFLKRPDDAEWRWTTTIRVVELSIWMLCLYILYRFFFLSSSLLSSSA